MNSLAEFVDIGSVVGILPSSLYLQSAMRSECSVSLTAILSCMVMPLATAFSVHEISNGLLAMRSRDHSSTSCITLNLVGDSQSYYGDSQNFMVKEFSQYEELEEIVGLASQPIPERPDGIVCVAKYSSASRKECRPTEPEYERLARDNPATVFLRCFEEYEGADLLFGQASVQNFPTYDVFYGGNRVARVEGSNISELQDVLSMYQLQNSQLDLFSEEATYKRKAQWGDGSAANMAKTPKTTNRFIPGYDWGSDRGFFDDQGDKAQQSFEDSFGNWLPNMEDE